MATTHTGTDWQPETKITTDIMKSIDEGVQSNTDLIDSFSNGAGGISPIVASGSIFDFADNNCSELGLYYLTATSAVSDIPESASFALILMRNSFTQAVMIAIRAGSNYNTYMCKEQGSAWGEWKLVIS